MPHVVFVAPLLSDNAFRMVEAAATLPDVQLSVITQDGEDRLQHLRGRVRHWRVDDILNLDQLAWGAEGLSRLYGPIHRLFGAFEQIQVQLAQVRERLGIDGMSVEAANNFRDKAQMKTLLRANGLPCARHMLAGTLGEARAFGESSGFPIVVKPPAGAGAVSTFRVDDMASLLGALQRTPPSPEHPVLLEEFVQGEEHSFETITIDGVHVWHSLTHYYPTPLTVLENPWIQWSLVLPREVDGPQYDDIRQAARTALDVLGMRTGISHMEWFRRKDGSIAISEVAARPPGAQITQLMSYAHDFDLVQEWARAMIFGEFRIPERRYAAGAAFLRGQGSGRIVKVLGVEEVNRALGSLIVASKTPQVGATPSPSYEGEGWVIVRHPETAVVERAVLKIIGTIRVELG
ncbi:MAG TPA: ATP-grasp domain-containing protein [Gemmatimonadaceae bacterium]|nr:ATP-grasp domain-containing protein [Gemmatimonadaceae bacterium]